MTSGDTQRLLDHAEFTTELLELRRSDPREFSAVLNARRLLAECGFQLDYPHTSAVRGSGLGLRELRPRAGRSRYRVLYRRFGGALVLLSLAPEAQHQPRGFAQAIARAEERARTVTEHENGDSHV